MLWHVIRYIGCQFIRKYVSWCHWRQKEIVRAGQFFDGLHPFSNFEIQRYHQSNIRFNAVYSKDNLPTIKDGTYVINEYNKVDTHWVTVFV